MVAEADQRFLKTIFFKGIPLILFTGAGFFLLRKFILLVFDYEISAVFLAVLVAVSVGIFSEKYIKPYIKETNRNKKSN